MREGYRGILVIPLLRPTTSWVRWWSGARRPGEFANSTIDLLQTFADQSVVAIQNARLFESVEARTRELAKSLGDLRTAQDRLVQTDGVPEMLLWIMHWLALHPGTCVLTTRVSEPIFTPQSKNPGLKVPSNAGSKQLTKT